MHPSSSSRTLRLTNFTLHSTLDSASLNIAHPSLFFHTAMLALLFIIQLLGYTSTQEMLFN